MVVHSERLPYAIGRFGWVWAVAVATLVVIVAWGVFAYSRQLIEGLVVTGMRDIGTMSGATWGLYIVFDIYFVGVSFAGITVAALIRLFNLEWLRPCSRPAELLTIVSLLMAGLVILADLGQPLRGLLHLPLYARPMSPFFGTFTLVVAGYLFASLVYFYLDGRRDAAICAQIPGRLQWFYRLWAAGYRDTPAERERHGRVSYILALLILPLLVTAHSTLGFVFGLQVGRPGWYSALQAPGFVVLAGASGIGLLIVTAAILRVTLREQERLTLAVFRWLGNFLMILTVIYLYFVLVEWLTATYQGLEHERHLLLTLLAGDYPWLYWSAVGGLVVVFLLLFAQFLTQRYSLGLLVFAGLIVNIAAVLKRILIVVPSQTHGTLLPYGPGFYSPTWVEYSIIAGLLALGTLLYILFTKIFPIIELPESAGG